MDGKAILMRPCLMMGHGRQVFLTWRPLGFTDLILSNYEHSQIADLWKTVCTFKKEAPQEDDPDNPDPDPDDPDPFDFDPKDTKTTWEFTAGVTSKSIFDHPDFKPMFQNNPDLRKAYEAIMSGRVDIESLKIDSKLKRKDPYDFGLGGREVLKGTF